MHRDLVFRLYDAGKSAGVLRDDDRISARFHILGIPRIPAGPASPVLHCFTGDPLSTRIHDHKQRHSGQAVPGAHDRPVI